MALASPPELSEAAGGDCIAVLLRDHAVGRERTLSARIRGRRSVADAGARWDALLRPEALPIHGVRLYAGVLLAGIRADPRGIFCLPCGPLDQFRGAAGPD